MISPRTVAVFVIASAALCLTIAVERYYATVRTAKAVAEQIRGFEIDSVGIPRETIVCGLAGIVLLVAGANLLFESFRGGKKATNEDGLLK